MSRNPHEPTDKIRAEVSALRSFGVPVDEIAVYIGIDKKTMYKYYPDELAQAHMKANANVGKFLYQAASGQALKEGASHSDCVRAAMFWAKTRMCWRETQDLNHQSEDGSMTPAPALDTSKLSTAALKELMQARESAESE